MNPNSQNQRWSLWTIRVTPAHSIRSDEEFAANTARFMRKAFGSTTEMRVEKNFSGSRGRITEVFIIQVRTEGHPAHDPAYVSVFAKSFLNFFTVGFGVGTLVSTVAVLEAGSAQDGTPSAQLVMLPGVNI